MLLYINWNFKSVFQTIHALAHLEQHPAGRDPPAVAGGRVAPLINITCKDKSQANIMLI